MEFSPTHPIVKLCIQGMAMEDKGDTATAARLFLQAWNEAPGDFEKYLAAYFVARQQQHTADKLQWLQTALELAQKINDDAVKAAFPVLHKSIAACYSNMGDSNQAKKHEELSQLYNTAPTDKGPFYHGTKADLKTGDQLTAGNNSNYQPELIMNHIYFTALANGAGLAASLAKGDGAERIYIVEPTGDFENDPNVTNKKFPGNPTRSYRTAAPLKIVGEITGWQKQTDRDIRQWKEKLANNKGNIIN